MCTSKMEELWKIPGGAADLAAHPRRVCIVLISAASLFPSHMKYKIETHMHNRNTNDSNAVLNTVACSATGQWRATRFAQLRAAGELGRTYILFMNLVLPQPSNTEECISFAWIGDPKYISCTWANTPQWYCPGYAPTPHGMVPRFSYGQFHRRVIPACARNAFLMPDPKRRNTFYKVRHLP